MGQKIHPTGFRLAVTRNWTSKWFANSKNFAPTLKEDIKMALETIRTHKVRSFLTVLGVVIGTMVAIVVASILLGVEKNVQDSLNEFGVDNLFVFLVIFQGFRISAERQHRALLWGVAGAVVLRALFIAAGVALLGRFAWINYVFGVFLLYAAWRLVRGGSAKAAIPEWIRRLQPAKGSLLPVIVAVEVTDLLFAVDSIPAVLAISHDPFVVYTSNIAAILGLRSLYFVLAGLLDRLRYLHYGLGALLAFIALKMLAAKWLEMPITLSLAIIGAILTVCTVWSALAPGQTPETTG